MRIGILALAVLPALPQSVASARSVNEEQEFAQENFRQSDKNGDGTLDRQEFRAFIDANADDDIGRAAMVRRFGAYDTAFERVDTNEDGNITRWELAAARED